MAMLPMLMYGLEVPAGDVAISARPDIPAAFRITMAAIDPSAAPEGEENVPPRATLKILRQPLGGYDFDDDEDDSEDFDADEMERMLAEESEEDTDDEAELNGGPSNPEKSKQAKRAAAEKAIEKLIEEEGMDIDDVVANGVNGSKKSAKAKGKMPASDEDDDELDDDEDDDDDEDGDEIEEFVICTLDPTKNYQQPLDITIGEGEKVWFKVSGTHTIYLTGNYVEPASTQPKPYDEDEDEDDEEDYDLDSDMDETEDDSDDMLDELEDPRITELDDEDTTEAPALVKVQVKKADTKAGKNKRRAEEDSDDDDVGKDAQTIDEMISKASAASGANGDAKLSKKQLKKLKKNDGAAAAAPAANPAKPTEADSSSNKLDKKVSFAKQLEQGPTPTKTGGKESATGSLGVKVVQGVTIDDKKLGTGQAAKAGDRVSMRYIGKLQKDNKQFDSNKKGKPFSFKLGSGEVIKGWDIGVVGMTAGGERRITIPAHLAYGSKSLPGIPPNSTLIFDIKLLDINKGK